MGLVVGDSLLLTVARRLSRHIGVQDTLARVGGDQFAILMLSGQHPTELTALAERVRRSLRSPIKIAGRDIALTASTGIAIYDGHEQDARELLKEAEIAMYRAKRHPSRAARAPAGDRRPRAGSAGTPQGCRDCDVSSQTRRHR